mmetsp:Transcript_2207/g.4695  ORF Transcript_2207/g.4695 Transcript_2207/m.4695 type:complete len:212 (-) Transcript_2207:2072-2707(-)
MWDHSDMHAVGRSSHIRLRRWCSFSALGKRRLLARQERLCSYPGPLREGRKRHSWPYHSHRHRGCLHQRPPLRRGDTHWINHMGWRSRLGDLAECVRIGRPHQGILHCRGPPYRPSARELHLEKRGDRVAAGYPRAHQSLAGPPGRSHFHASTPRRTRRPLRKLQRGCVRRRCRVGGLSCSWCSDRGGRKPLQNSNNNWRVIDICDKPHAG